MNYIKYWAEKLEPYKRRTILLLSLLWPLIIIFLTHIILELNSWNEVLTILIILYLLWIIGLILGAIIMHIQMKGIMSLLTTNLPLIPILLNILPLGGKYSLGDLHLGLGGAIF